MKRVLALAALMSVVFLGAVDVRAAVVVFSLKSPSQIALNATLPTGLPLDPQEGTAGTTDYNTELASNETTYQGTITVDVDNLLAPTTIKILSANVDADVSGKWLPRTDPTKSPFTAPDVLPAQDADHAMKFNFFADLLYAAARDVVYDVASGTEAVDASGSFSSASQVFTFTSGQLDYWYDLSALQAGLMDAGSDDLTGDDGTNAGDDSSYIVSEDGGLQWATLMIPVLLESGGDFPNTRVGTLYATAQVPEPATLILMGVGLVGLAAFARRRK
jgi:hypothetical protein